MQQSLSPLSSVDAVIVCGGFGTRLRTVVADRPKVLALISNRPFLDILLERLAGIGFSRFVLCTGYLHEQIASHVASSCASGAYPYAVDFSVEREPLGTGGALLNARNSISSDSFFVFNGDTFCDVDCAAFFRFHQEKKSLCSLALSSTLDARDYGGVVIDEDSRIQGFFEKNTEHSGLVSAGAYIMNKGVFDRMVELRQASFSLERDFFPTLISSSFFGYSAPISFLDIGVPERYQKAQDMFPESPLLS
jgi:D-glycero-alpha-D-manno-heptose 1-phosphate guanylyltransferase